MTIITTGTVNIPPGIQRKEPMLKLTYVEQRLALGFNLWRVTRHGDARRRPNGRPKPSPAWAALSNQPLLTQPDHNQKIAKNETPTYSLTLAPARQSGHNVCPRSTPQCRASCLVSAGRFAMGDHMAAARVRRTTFMVEQPDEFFAQLFFELERAARKHPDGFGLRLNALSDIRWELVAPDFFTFLIRLGARPYDYSSWGPDERPGRLNYDLTFSAKERHTTAGIVNMVAAGHRVSVVTADKDAWLTANLGVPVVDGDLSDQRYSDGPAVIVLKPKGKARRAPVGWKHFVKPGPQ